MIDEKKCYLFGRNPQLNDFCIDHSSCSRVHAAYVYHKHLNISYLVDLGSSKCLQIMVSILWTNQSNFSAHGTFIGNLQIEPHKPTQLHINSTFHFGASTRLVRRESFFFVCFRFDQIVQSFSYETKVLHSERKTRSWFPIVEQYNGRYSDDWFEWRIVFDTGNSDGTWCERTFKVCFKNGQIV